MDPNQPHPRYCKGDVIVSCRLPFKYLLVSFLIWHEPLSSFAIETGLFRNIRRISMDEHIRLSDATGCAAFQLPKKEHTCLTTSVRMIHRGSFSPRFRCELPELVLGISCMLGAICIAQLLQCLFCFWGRVRWAWLSGDLVSISILVGSLTWWVGLCDHLVCSMPRHIRFHDQCRLAGISKFRKQARQWTSPVRQQNKDWPAGAF